MVKAFKIMSSLHIMTLTILSMTSTTKKIAVRYHPFFLSGDPIAWTSRKQPCITNNVTQTKYITISTTTKEVIWMRTFLTSIECPQLWPTWLYCDNWSCIKLVHNLKSLRRTKHINVVFHISCGGLSTLFILEPMIKKLTSWLGF